MGSAARGTRSNCTGSNVSHRGEAVGRGKRQTVVLFHARHGYSSADRGGSVDRAAKVGWLRYFLELYSPALDGGGSGVGACWAGTLGPRGGIASQGSASVYLLHSQLYRNCGGDSHCPLAL